MANSKEGSPQFIKSTVKEFNSLYYGRELHGLYCIEDCDFCRKKSKRRVYYKDISFEENYHRFPESDEEYAADVFNHIYRFCNENCFNLYILNGCIGATAG